MKITDLRAIYPSRSLAIRLGAAGILTIGAFLTNVSFLGWGLFFIFAVLIVPFGRVRGFLFAFVPYAAAWFIFTALRSIADETILAKTLNANAAEFERWLFGGQLPTVMLQDRYFEQLNLHWWDYTLTGIHWSYFIMPHAVAVYVWLRHPKVFRQYIVSTLLCLTIGLLIYFLIPTNPPWMAPDSTASPASPWVYRVMTDVGATLGGGLYEAGYKVIGESNPIAAMPSMHMAITFLILFPVWQVRRSMGIAALVYGLLMGLALIYLGEHYFIDIAVGAMIATYSWFASGAWLNRIAPVAMRNRRGEWYIGDAADQQPSERVHSAA